MAPEVEFPVDSSLLKGWGGDGFVFYDQAIGGRT